MTYTIEDVKRLVPEYQEKMPIGPVMNYDGHSVMVDDRTFRLLLTTRAEVEKLKEMVLHLSRRLSALGHDA